MRSHRCNPNLPLSVTSVSVTSSFQAAETDELPVSSQVEEEPQHEQTDLVILALISCQYQKDLTTSKLIKKLN